MVTQLDVQRLSQCAGEITEACNAWGESPFRLGAVCLVESGAGYAPGYAPQGDPDGWGDHGFAFGYFQIDRRFHADFLSRPESKELAYQAHYACGLLHEARTFLRAYLVGEPLEVGVVCSYNAGAENVMKAVRAGHDPNAVTEHGNYGSRVFTAEGELRALAGHLFVVVDAA